MWMPVFPAIFERLAGNVFSGDRSATQLPAILCRPLNNLATKRGKINNIRELIGLTLTTISMVNAGDCQLQTDHISSFGVLAIHMTPANAFCGERRVKQSHLFGLFGRLVARICYTPLLY